MAALTEQYETAQSAWKDACLFWYDIWCESHQEPEPFSTDGPGTSDFKQAEAQDLKQLCKLILAPLALS